MAPDALWQPPPPAPIASGEAVHVWRASLDGPQSRTLRLQQTLADDEISRANRFYRQRDRARFIAARGLLRTILGSYLDRDPRHLRLCYGPHGKPALAGPWGEGGLTFNASHSHGLALYAIARGRAVGIDLERLRGDVACEEIAQQFFSPRERAALHALPPERRQAAFFACWTRKEAYLKARGGGLSLPLDGFDVSLDPHEPARLLSVRDEPEAAGRWSLRALEPGPDYAAALAVEGRGWRLRCWQCAE